MSWNKVEKELGGWQEESQDGSKEGTLPGLWEQPTANTSCVLQGPAFASPILEPAICKPRKHSVQPHMEWHPRVLPRNHIYTQQEAVTAGSTLVNCDLTEIHLCAAGTGNCPQNVCQIPGPSLSSTPSVLTIYSHTV